MLNITIDKVRHIEDKDANVRETLVELQHALDKSEQERHFYDALCIDYTAAYLCDLMAYLDDHESFVYRHRTLPNRAGMEYFEARVVRLYSDDDSYKIILGYRPIDDIVEEERESRQKLEQALKRAEERHHWLY